MHSQTNTNFPNSNIGKATLSFYGGGGLITFSGNVSDYFTMGDGATMSLYFARHSFMHRHCKHSEATQYS
jgi:hypothetical protein